MEFDLITEMGRDYSWLLFILMGVILALFLSLILDETNLSAKSTVACCVVLFFTVSNVGLALSFNKVEKTNEEKSLSQISDYGATIIDKGNNLFSSPKRYKDGLEGERYNRDHRLSLRLEDGITYACRTTVPVENSQKEFFVDCLDPKSSSESYIPLDELQKAS